MACISKLANAIAYDCDTGATGITRAVIINKADIASFTVESNVAAVSALTLVPGATAYKIDTVKRSLVISSALKVNDGAPNAFSHSASITFTGGESVSATRRILASALSNGSFVIIAERAGFTGGDIYGLYYGLSATASDMSTHENGGWTTTTLETPENVIGEDTLTLAKVVWDSLYAAAVG